MDLKLGPTYQGALNRPIVRRHLGILGDLVGEEQKRIYNEWNKKLDLLLQHFEISTSDLDCWQLLATALALTHVRGFQLVGPQKRRGRRKTWTVSEAKALVETIDSYSEKRTLKARFNAAMKHPDWRWGKNSASIETRYYEAKKRLGPFDTSPLKRPFDLRFEWMRQRVATKQRMDDFS